MKCANCGKAEGEHHSKTKGCPIGRKDRVMGYTMFSETEKFKEKKVRHRENT